MVFLELECLGQQQFGHVGVLLLIVGSQFGAVLVASLLLHGWEAGVGHRVFLRIQQMVL